MLTRWVRFAIFYLPLYCTQKICVTCERKDPILDVTLFMCLLSVHQALQCLPGTVRLIFILQKKKKGLVSPHFSQSAKGFVENKSTEKSAECGYSTLEENRALCLPKYVAGLFSKSGGRGKRRIERLRYWKDVENRKMCCETSLCALGSQRLWLHNHTKYTRFKGLKAAEGKKECLFSCSLKAFS